MKTLVTIIVAIITFSLFTQPSGYVCTGSYLTFTLDDGYLDHYTEAFPLFKNYNFPATAYIPSGLVGKVFENNTLMDWWQIEDIKRAGWEIGSHGIYHENLTVLEPEDIEKIILQSKKDFIESGILAETLAIPYGRYNSAVKELAKKHFIAVRPSEWGYNSLKNLDKYSLKSLWVTNTTTVDEMKGWVTEGNKAGTWTILMIHFVRDDKSDEYTITPVDLENLLSYVKSEKVEVRTVAEVVKECG